MGTCKYCNNQFESNLRLGGHLVWCKKNPEYLEKTVELKRKMSSIHEGKKLSEDHKKSLSEAMKKSHRSGNHPGWSHINTNPERMSRPEKKFYGLLKSNGILEKYKIKYGLSVSKYFLDFAFLDYKIDVEIDGVQHIRNESNINHDKIRDKFLTDEGWSVYRISVKELEDQNIILDLLKFIDNRSKYRKYDPEKILEQYSPTKNIYGSRLDYSNAIKEKNNIKVLPIIKELINSGIDFNKHGWKVKASKIIGIKPQKVEKWMRRYMEDFYIEKCYHRKKE